MVLKAPLNTSLVKVDDSHLIYLNDFGSVSYQGEDFLIDRLDLLTPSVHMVNLILISS